MEGKALKIKVCGLRRLKDILTLNDLMPDFFGYIFYPPSPRYVGDNPAPAIFAEAAPEIIKTGVFVNVSREHILDKAKRYKLDAVQLHGEESPAYCRLLKDEGLLVVKALRGGAGNIYPAMDYPGTVDYLLWDTPAEERGGSGKKFDWSRLDTEADLPFLLSGGIGPEDAGLIRDLKFRSMIGVDINSRFETSPGVKNTEAIKDFINIIRNGKN